MLAAWPQGSTAEPPETHKLKGVGGVVTAIATLPTSQCIALGTESGSLALYT